MTIADAGGSCNGSVNGIPLEKTNDSPSLLHASETADHGAGLVKAVLPGWSLAAEADARAARDALVDSACSWRADLIVVGSHGRTGLKRLVLGSVAALEAVATRT